MTTIPACNECNGTGYVMRMTYGRGPDDYEQEIECPKCKGTGEPPAAPVQLEPSPGPIGFIWQSALDKLGKTATKIDLWASPEQEPGELAVFLHPAATVQQEQYCPNCNCPCCAGLYPRPLPDADLRAELASAEARYNYESKRCDQAEVALKRAEAERDSLRAELARLQSLNRMVGHAADAHSADADKWAEENHKLRAERDSLRALLQRTRQLLNAPCQKCPEPDCAVCAALIVEIDAALKGTP